MKKLICVLMVMIFAFFSAYSEETPDGSVRNVYFPFFEKEALDGFQFVLYPEKSGLLLSAYSDEAEITVTVEQNESADAKVFLADYIEGMSRYASLTNAPEILAWEREREQAGAKAYITYRLKKASDEEGAYAVNAFSEKIDENMFLLIVFNSWAEDSERLLKESQDKFFASFRLENREVSKPYLALVKNARADDEGNQYVTVDFCQVVYDQSIFAVYALNDREESFEYSLSKDALIWTYDINASLYTHSLSEPTAENLIETAAHYYEKMGFDIIFQIMFDETGEIVWMMHYNAF